MKTKRLLILAKELERLIKLPKSKMPIKFDMKCWGAQKLEKYNKRLVPTKYACLTQACAFGTAATIPALRKAGLVLRHDPDSYLGNCNLAVQFKENTGIYAAVKFFDIPKSMAVFLFEPNEYPFRHRNGKPALKAVVARIKALVAGAPLIEAIAEAKINNLEEGQFSTALAEIKF